MGFFSKIQNIRHFKCSEVQQVTGLSNIKKLPNKKLGFHVSNIGRGTESLRECGLPLADRSEMECLRMAVLPFLPSLEHANKQLPSVGLGGPQATIFASCCSNFEMRSS